MCVNRLTDYWEFGILLGVGKGVSPLIDSEVVACLFFNVF